MFDTGPDDVPADTDNVTDWCLRQFRDRYDNTSISKDDIWHYLYGVMHAPDWRERYRHDLQRNLPRVPFADDFEAFRDAGCELMDIHADYGTVPEHTDVRCLVDGFEDDGQASPEKYRIAGRMRWRDKNLRTVLEVNPDCWLSDIPADAHRYQVSGRSPLEWAVDQLQDKRHKVGVNDDGDRVTISDDANGWTEWADDPFELIRHLRRLVWLSVRSAEIVDGLPPSLTGDTAAGDHRSSGDSPAGRPEAETETSAPAGVHSRWGLVESGARPAAADARTR